jgi:DNA-binding transcriptional LysR family regulator
MRIEHLKYLVEVAECGSMSKAAKNLFVSQPAISNALSMLEREIGWEVLERTAYGVQPTTKGKLVVDDAHRILQMINRWSDVVDLPNIDKITGDVYVADYSEMGLSFFQDIIMELNRVYPKLVVHSVPLEATPLKELNNGRFQMVALPIVPEHHKAVTAYLEHYDWTLETLYTQNCRLILPKDSALAQHQALTSDMLVGYDLLAYPDFPYQKRLEDQIRRALVRFDEPLRLISAVSTSQDAIAFFPPSQDVFLQAFIESGIFVERELSDIPLPMEVDLIYADHFARTDAGQLLIKEIQRHYANVPAH